MTDTITNPGFEDGDTGWTKGTGWTIISGTGAYAGNWYATINANDVGDQNSDLVNTYKAAVAPGQSVTAQARVKGGGHDDNMAAVMIYWFDAASSFLSTSIGNYSSSSSPNVWELSTVTASAPASAAFMSVAISGRGRVNGGCAADDVSWNYVSDRTVTLVSPANGSSYLFGDEVLFSVTIGGTSPAITKVEYKTGSTVLATTTSPDYSFNVNTLAVGSHSVFALVTFADGSTITSASNTVTITALPPPVVTREYKASNSYAYLAAQNFSGLGSAIPSVAKIVGVEVLIDYKVRALIRSKDLNIVDPLGSNSNVAFDITDGALIEATLIETAGASYTVDGAAISTLVPLTRSDFSPVEEGTSEGKKWTVMETAATTVTLGSATEMFGLTPVALADFITRSIGIRFLPALLPKPSYADSGDCCFRFYINQLKLRVYFDAGSAEYYFASSDKTQVLKGTLVSANVSDGDFRTGDAEGELQLQPELVIKDGTTTYIGDDWTIHAAYPPTDANQIGTVAAREEDDSIGMSYNGLPSAENVMANRSRFEFITTNFYAVNTLDSIYGVHGLPRAFAFNADFFYKIWTQPEESKDMPRHIANNQGSLALGFDDGRVDISVAGSPYNFDGLSGASEWSNGDPVVGLLPLSGTILGVFCKKSIWGISGSTVENYATQVITPKIGAIEYTVSDMGAPVYANSYGIYTLSQTQQYGDYLGSPMSQDISPWLRPRLIRALTSNKEVVVAWPVRTKNQYRLAFSDGYVLSMTLNVNSTLNVSTSPVGQEVATFSFQKYFYSPVDWSPSFASSLLDYPYIVPIAISSELDVTGEERIHMSNIPLPLTIISNVGEPVVFPYSPLVYELEKGWSFDGNYIPHYLETNWYFGHDPTTYSTIQKTRIHGLSKGHVNLQVSTNGIQTDYKSDYTNPQVIDLPNKAMFINPDFQPITNYAETVNRGLAIQFKFEGRNTDYTLPEPCHVIQVLVIETPQQGTGAKAN